MLTSINQSNPHGPKEQKDTFEFLLAKKDPGKWNAQTSLGFWDQNRSPNLSQKTRPSDSQQKKRTCRRVDFIVLADHKVKVKESPTKDKYLDLARELRGPCNMKETLIANVICTRYSY